MSPFRALLLHLARRSVPDLDTTIWPMYDQLLAEGLPSEPTLGARLVVRLSALTLAAYRSLRQAGLDEAAARQQTAALTWAFYRPAAFLLWRLARLCSRHPLARVRQAMRWTWRFPYNPPGYLMQEVEVRAEGYGFDVLRCPAADYLRRQGAGALCQAAWCDLDDRLAAAWGLRLERSGTLASGAPRCDFRFRL